MLRHPLVASLPTMSRHHFSLRLLAGWLRERIGIARHLRSLAKSPLEFVVIILIGAAILFLQYVAYEHLGFNDLLGGVLDERPRWIIWTCLIYGAFAVIWLLMLCMQRQVLAVRLMILLAASILAAEGLLLLSLLLER